jgi:predicted membrane metal-binding protein
MAVVAGVVFFAIRALLALIPVLAVAFPIKKWAAAAALAAAAFYLLLSGAEVATQRSFYMTAVVLIAVMVDRRAVTFRTLAVAAMIVLAIAPEALVHPSFQRLGHSLFLIVEKPAESRVVQGLSAFRALGPVRTKTGQNPAKCWGPRRTMLGKMLGPFAARSPA